MHLAAAFQDLVSHSLDDAGQAVGANVRVSVGQNGGRSAELAEHAQNFLYIAALLRSRVEFAVGVGSRAALAEGVVALGVDGVAARNLRYVLAALVHILATFQHHGAAAQFDEAQRCKQAARPCAHHHHPRCALHVGVVHGFVVECRSVFVDKHLEREVDKHLPLAGVDAAASQAQVADGAALHAQRLSHVPAQLPVVGGHVGRHA